MGNWLYVLWMSTMTTKSEVMERDYPRIIGILLVVASVCRAYHNHYFKGHDDKHGDARECC